MLDVAGMSLALGTPDGFHEVLHAIDLRVEAGQTVGLVGESGCGKSVTALAIMRLLPNARYLQGSMRLDGQELLGLSEKQMRRLRGNRMAMIFQEPMTSLNPLMSVGSQIAEAVKLHRGLDSRAALAQATKLLDTVGIPGAARRTHARPHELSGGQRQRVMIAMALACKPRLLMADEPTTALDVTVQAQILDLLDALKQEMGMALLLITHDLAIVSNYCDAVSVMYAGRIVESRPVEALFDGPAHPYTEALLKTSPSEHAPGSMLPTIQGSVPALGKRGAGCLFAPRCAYARANCHQLAPEPTAVAGEAGLATVACWYPRHQARNT